MFNKNHCSPRKKRIKSSCLSKDILIKIAKLLNKTYNTKIKIKNRTKKELFNDVQKNFQKSECDFESCWSKLQLFNTISQEDKKKIIDSFKPEKPPSWKKKPPTW